LAVGKGGRICGGGEGFTMPKKDWGLTKLEFLVLLTVKLQAGGTPRSLRVQYFKHINVHVLKNILEKLRDKHYLGSDGDYYSFTGTGGTALRKYVMANHEKPFKEEWPEDRIALLSLENL
jgi:hypothetical protein